MMKLLAVLLVSMVLTLEILAVPLVPKLPGLQNDKEKNLKNIAELFCQVKSTDGKAKVKNDSNLFKAEDNLLCGPNNKGGFCSSLCQGDDSIHANVECIAKIVTQKGSKSDEIFRKYCDGKSS